MRFVSLLTVFCFTLNAAVLEATYDISYWFLEHIATTTLRFESSNGHYRIDASAELHGFAAALAHHHSEHHTSIGRTDAAGKLIPEVYIAIRTLDGYRREQRFTFDRRQRQILLRQREMRVVKTRWFDPVAMRYTVSETPREHTFFRRETYYADDDLLTLYFNARALLKALPPNTLVSLPCVGSRDGIVKAQKRADPLEFILFINQDIFRSKEGKLDVEMDKDLYVKKAVLKDVFLFGDLEVKRVGLNPAP